MHPLKIINIWLKSQRIYSGLFELSSALELTQEFKLIEIIQDILPDFGSYLGELNDRLALDSSVLDEFSMSEILSSTPEEVLEKLNLENDAFDLLTFKTQIQYDNFIFLKNRLNYLYSEFQLSNIDSRLISFLEYLQTEVDDLVILFKLDLDNQ